MHYFHRRRRGRPTFNLTIKMEDAWRTIPTRKVESNITSEKKKKTKGTCHSKALQPSSRSAILMLNQNAKPWVKGKTADELISEAKKKRAREKGLIR